MKPSELIRKAQRNISNETWCQYANSRVINGRVCRCAVEHLRHAFPSKDMIKKGSAVYFATNAITGNFLRPEAALSAWNDRPGRTAMQVKTLFDMVASRLEKEGR